MNTSIPITARHEVKRFFWLALLLLTCGIASSGCSTSQRRLTARAGNSPPRECEQIKRWLTDGPLVLGWGPVTRAEQLANVGMLLDDPRFSRAFGKSYAQTTSQELESLLNVTTEVCLTQDPALRAALGAVHMALDPSRLAYKESQLARHDAEANRVANLPLPAEGTVYTPSPPSGLSIKPTTDVGLGIELHHIGNAMRCGRYYRYLDMDRKTSDQRCSGKYLRCETYSLSPPEDDARQIREAFTFYDKPGANTEIISTGRWIDRSKAIPIPFATDLMAFTSFPASVIDLALLAPSVGDVGTYLQVDGTKTFCTPYNYLPIMHEAERASLQDNLMRKGAGKTLVCNDDRGMVTMATLSIQQDFRSVYSNMEWIGRGWFNVRPRECLTLDSLMGTNDSVVIYAEFDGKPSRYPAVGSYNGDTKEYAGFSGYGNEDAPLCVRRGGPFRYQRALDSRRKPISSCPAGMITAQPSFIVRNASSNKLVVRLRATDIAKGSWSGAAP